MKVNLSLRVIVIFLFLFLYLSSLFFINIYFNRQQKEIDKAYQSFHIDESLSQLSFKTAADSLQAKEMARNIRESLMAIDMIRAETQIYSVLFLILLMLISIVVFIFVFYKITKPLQELQSATAKIRDGDFSVSLPVAGIKEMRLLQQSFNNMSNELDHTQRKLILAEKEMIWKDISRMLAHEIKNPLTPIQLSTQRLEEKFIEDPERFKTIFPESIRIINQEVDNLRNLVKSFSGFAKTTEPEMTVFVPADEIARIAEPYQHDYHLILDLSAKMRIKFDRTHFYQIITNILQNAVDACGAKKEIIIRLNRSSNRVRIAVTDQGTGIADADIPQVFDPYFTRKDRGTGLGLAVVKKLCDANMADIKVESTPGNGTTFAITIEEYK